MITIDIPGRGTIELEHLVMDVNGTIAVDGQLVLGIVPRMQQLRQVLNIHLLTADIHDSQAQIEALLNLRARIITRGAAEKAAFVQHLGASSAVAIGNGANDVGMCHQAAIGIAVMGGEGLAGALLQTADVVVADIQDGLDLLIHPNRLRATLRL